MSYDHLDLEGVLQRVDDLRREVEAERPVAEDRLGRALQRLRLEWTYHSNAIEGNTLSYGETRALLLHGVTAQGKPLKDHLDIRRHREALDFLERFARSEEPLTLAAVRELHKVLLGDEPYEIWAETPEGEPTKRLMTPGEFKTLPNNVHTATGETHYYASPEETPAKMQEVVDGHRETEVQVEQGAIHPLPFAADFHHRFVAIHPFDDGNGRLGRLLMNLVLMQSGYVPAVVRRENRSAYYGVLAQADAGDLGPLVRFLGDELAATMRLYLSALRGEPDPDEFDRRLSLLNRQVETLEQEGKTTRSPEVLALVAESFVQPLLRKIDEGVQRVSHLFNSVEADARCTDDTGQQKATLGQIWPMPFPSDNWLAIAAFCSLKGYRLRPSEDLSVMCQVSTGSTGFSTRISVGGKQVTSEVDYGSDLMHDQALGAASKALEALLDEVENIQRRVEEQNAADS